MLMTPLTRPSSSTRTTSYGSNREPTPLPIRRDSPGIGSIRGDPVNNAGRSPCRLDPALRHQRDSLVLRLYIAGWTFRDISAHPSEALAPRRPHLCADSWRLRVVPRAVPGDVANPVCLGLAAQHVHVFAHIHARYAGHPWARCPGVRSSR